MDLTPVTFTIDPVCVGLNDAFRATGRGTTPARTAFGVDERHPGQSRSASAGWQEFERARTRPTGRNGLVGVNIFIFRFADGKIIRR